MNLFQIAVESIFFLTQILIAVFSIHYIYIFISRLFLPKTYPSHELLNSHDLNLPFVTIQFPIFNEKHVIKRLISEVALMDYPSDRLEIQLLDDSIDETSTMIRTEIEKFSSLNFVHIKRTNRQGYKAGALNEGLRRAQGEFLAIFDADFIPARNFLLETIPRLQANPQLGFIQTRWGHLNKNQSLLTKSISLSIDNHFLVEQPVRNSIGVMNFNGTCGIWRKTCIVDAGGWDGSILAEDLDLSYRSYMKGWKADYLEDVVCNGEIPDKISSFKQQQYRWAKGTSQSAKKNLSAIFRSNLTMKQKIESIFHHFGYFIQVLIFINLLCFAPLIYYSSLLLVSTWGLYFFIINLIASSMYLFTATRLKMHIKDTVKSIILVTLLSIGISWKTTLASLVGLIKTSGEFKRTPKGLYKKNSEYIIFAKGDLVIEFLIICYLFGSIYLAIMNEIYLPIIYLVFCLFGFGMIFSLHLLEITLPITQNFRLVKSIKRVFQSSN